MNPTIKDIARIAGVSYSTVSKALNDSPLVKHNTKTKILEAARELGYQPNMFAKSLVSKKSNIIGAVWPRARVSSAWSSIIFEINETLANYSYDMLLSINPIESAIANFNRFRMDGILIFYEQIVDDKCIKSSHVPTLYYGSPLASNLPTVNVNRSKAIFEAVRYLIELGHKRIAYIGDLYQSDITQHEKYNGFTEAIKHFNLTGHSEMKFETKTNTPEAGYLACKNMLNSAFKPTAVVVGSYGLSTGVIKALDENRLKVPDDISVISYDNIPQMENFAVPLTSVGVSETIVARTIVTTLIQLIENPGNVPFYTELDVELIPRASCAPPL